MLDQFAEEFHVVYVSALHGRTAIVPIALDAVGIDENEVVPIREFIESRQFDNAFALSTATVQRNDQRQRFSFRR